MNYYQKNSNFGRRRIGFGPGVLSPFIKVMLIANVSIFIIQLIHPPTSQYFGLIPKKFFVEFPNLIFQPFTYMFLHADIGHILWNMLILYFCGPSLEQIWGGKRFFRYYIYCGLGAGLCSFIFSFNRPVIGSSGAVYGLLLACAMLFPEARALVFFIFPMKIRHLAWMIVGIGILGAIGPLNDGIAHIAHLGGILFGFLYFKNIWLRSALDTVSLTKLKTQFNQRKTKPRAKQSQNLDREVDRILEKISRQGMDSLTRQERRILEEKSKLK